MGATNEPGSSTDPDEAATVEALRVEGRALGAQLAAGRVGLDTLEQLRLAWANPSAAEAPLLLEVAEEVLGGRREVLECGSGLSTLVLAHLAAARPEVSVTVLEHDRSWLDRTLGRLAACGLPRPGALLAPLRSFGGFDWYGVERPEVVGRPSLVICDGPPAYDDTVRGGRLGLLPVLGARLAGALVLLDDAERDSEQAVLRAWTEGHGARVEALRSSGAKSYARVLLPGV